MIIVCPPADCIERLIRQAPRKNMQSYCAPRPSRVLSTASRTTREDIMLKPGCTFLIAALTTLIFAFPANSQSPTLRVDPYWPRPLPNNWIIGQVGGIYVDAQDNIWVFQRPRSVTDDEKAAAFDPPRAKCCVPAPSVLVFNQAGDIVKSWGGPGDNLGYDWPL